MEHARVRTCGPCTACCDYFPIKAIGKVALKTCEYLSDPKKDCNNCTIHGDHPTVCKEYACMWVAGYGEEEDRPDQCGMIIDSMTPVKNALRGVPIRAGAQDEEAGIKAVNNISKQSNKPVMVCKFPETKMLRIVGRGHG
jgi:Fe-S-cluster containining protein